MRRIAVISLFLTIPILLFPNNIKKEDFIIIEKLIDNKSYKEADNSLNKLQPFISQSSSDLKELYYCNRGYLYLQLGDYNNTIANLNAAMQIIYSEQFFNTEEHLRVAFYLASAYYLTGNITNAEQLINISLVRASSIWEDCKYSHRLYQLLLTIYEQYQVSSGIIGQIKDEIGFLPVENRIKSNKTGRVFSITLDESFPLESYISQVDSICLYYAESNQFGLSEKKLDEADSIIAKHGLQNHPLVGILMLQRGKMRFRIGDIENAKELFNKAKSYFEREPSYSSAFEYADCLNSLALVYQEEQKYIYSTILLYAALANSKTSNSLIHRHLSYNDKLGAYLGSMDNLAKNYYSMGDHEQALSKWITIIETAENEGAWNAAFSATANYAYAQIQLGNYQAGINKLKNVMQRDYNYLLKEAGFQNLLILQYLSNDEDISSTLKDYLSFSKKNIITILSSYSESERERYWDEQAKVLEKITNAICWKFNKSDLSQEAFNTTLSIKNAQLKLHQRIRSFFLNEASPHLRKRYHKLLSTKQKYIKKSTPQDSLPIIKNDIDTNEKKLLADLTDYGFIFNDSSNTFQSIKSSLSPRDVAIEFVRIPEFINDADSTTVFYGAWVIRNNYESPLLVKLCDEMDLHIALYEYDSSIFESSLYNINSNKLYELLFHQLAPHLNEGDTIYFSPVGEIYKINLMAIPYNNSRLLDSYVFKRVMSLGSIVEGKNKEIISSALVYGGISYNEDLQEMSKEAEYYNCASSTRFSITRSLNRSLWDNLPNSYIEAQLIDSICRSNNISVTTITGEKANEESIKSQSGSSPDIIHMATHGFFYPYKERPQNEYFEELHSETKKILPMQLCGLLFAGANNTWCQKAIPNGIEDGILTAEEISHLDLSGTSLCVLSACDTGLGQIDEVDGIYGIQRALKQAGVGSILMSLNKVDDEATRILMVEFYKNLLCGKSKHQSLRDAQKYLRQVDNGKYDDPKYWAAFILLDGLD